MIPSLLNFFGLGPKANARIVIRGNVYEGAYVQHAQKAAQRASLLGWMRSESHAMNQHIEMEVQGSKAEIDKLLVILQKGTPLCKITKIEVDWRSLRTNLTAFRVRT